MWKVGERWIPEHDRWVELLFLFFGEKCDLFFQKSPTRYGTMSLSRRSISAIQKHVLLFDSGMLDYSESDAWYLAYPSLA